MKKLFYIGCIGLVMFEMANVYFIMPMPGSQQMDSLGLAYFLYQWRWPCRILFAAALMVGMFRANWKRNWTLLIPLLVVATAIYLVNFKMAADVMFTQPKSITLSNTLHNKVDKDRLVMGVVQQGIARAYPIQYLGYHHFVYDTLNGKHILVTYCTVCRTGRVYDPTVNNKPEKFRLVGMDHFNAMIEDATTKSWWRQATGEAVAGKLKGTKLKEIQSTQTSLALWLQLYSNSSVMQADAASIKKYDTAFNFENGKSKSKLTGTDSVSWQNKSWVVGIKIKNHSEAFDWNELKQEKLLQSTIANTNIFLILAKDEKSFFAYENPFPTNPTLVNDTIYLHSKRYQLNGVGIDTSFVLRPLYAYQEFWHSWKSFSQNNRK